jgi:hypothetical protein
VLGRKGVPPPLVMTPPVSSVAVMAAKISATPETTNTAMVPVRLRRAAKGRQQPAGESMPGGRFGAGADQNALTTSHDVGVASRPRTWARIRPENPKMVIPGRGVAGDAVRQSFKRGGWGASRGRGSCVKTLAPVARVEQRGVRNVLLVISAGRTLEDKIDQHRPPTAWRKRSVAFFRALSAPHCRQFVGV